MISPLKEICPIYNRTLKSFVWSKYWLVIHFFKLFLISVFLQSELRISCFRKIGEIHKVKPFKSLKNDFWIRSKVSRVPLWMKHTPFKFRVTYNNENSPLKMVGEVCYLLQRQDLPTPIEPLSFSPPDNPTTDIVT